MGDGAFDGGVDSVERGVAGPSGIASGQVFLVGEQAGGGVAFAHRGDEPVDQHGPGVGLGAGPRGELVEDRVDEGFESFQIKIVNGVFKTPPGSIGLVHTPQRPLIWDVRHRPIRTGKTTDALREDRCEEVVALDAIGINPLEERIYRVLLERPASDENSLAEACGADSQWVRRALAALEVKGLASRLPGRPSRFLPTPPDIGMEILILHHQQELEKVRLGMFELMDVYRASADTSDVDRLIEILRGRETIAQRIQHMQRRVGGGSLTRRPPQIRT
ncbi:helix-turn-helix domain-containing protein [Micromonospora sp. NPDC047548]|uniref:TrmB family transcriptional regulator n=1 Tax=Micromonospora sp. NPDC047548 TaxID=3155624 RepID=UPI0033D59CBB